MTITEAQRDVRTVFLGGFAGQIVSSAVWFLSAATAAWRSPWAAMEVLVFAGIFIFPMTQFFCVCWDGRLPSPKGTP